MKVELDKSLTKVNVWATWYTGDKPAGWMPIHEAYDELETGRAVVIAENMILLTEKQKPFRIRVLERDEYICYFCGDSGNTLEHLQPVSKGGKNTFENCVCACTKCNSHKGNMTESEYWKYLAKQYIASEKNRQKQTQGRKQHV